MTTGPTAPHAFAHADVLAVLAWYQAMGVDAALGDQPIDWLARGPVAPGQTFQWPNRPSASGGEAAGTATNQIPGHMAGQRAPGPPSLAAQRAERPSTPALRTRPQTPLAASEAETEARHRASSAATLAALEAALRDFDGCTLKATAKNLCFYRGAPEARLMLIGEAPGRDEDMEGRPFVGRAGQLLDKMLAAIGLGEGDVHITNVVYWRPPGNRTPTPQEALACRPFLQRQMELVRPNFVVALGGAAAKEVFGVAEGIMRLRGKWRDIDIGGAPVKAMATLHPAYLLRTPAAKQLAWQDLLSIKARLAT